MRVVLTGGGTGGHVNPALSVAAYFKNMDPNTRILFIGTKHGMESQLVPAAGFPIEYIDVRGFKRKFTFRNITAGIKAITALGKVKKILKKFKPDIVIGTGGYVSGPVLYEAAAMKIPTLIHEQNVIPGLTVKMLTAKVDITATSFDSTQSFLSKAKKIVLTGNPVRPDLLSMTKQAGQLHFGFDGRPLVLVMGGSLGAEKLNDAIADIILHMDLTRFNLLVSTGKAYYDKVEEKLGNRVRQSNVVVVPYIYDSNAAFAAADLVVCRTGAITVSEVCAAGKASVLVPSPNVVHNHQEYNARYLEEKGAARVILDKDLTAHSLYHEIGILINDTQTLAKMGEAAKKIGSTDACKKIYEAAMSIVRPALMP